LGSLKFTRAHTHGYKVKKKKKPSFSLDLGPITKENLTLSPVMAKAMTWELGAHPVQLSQQCGAEWCSE
jgi:hypothetical protein